MTATGDFPGCDPTLGCVTCGDEAVAMQVRRFDERHALALCEGEGRSELVDTMLVGAVHEGDAVLVHAGVALQRMG